MAGEEAGDEPAFPSVGGKEPPAIFEWDTHPFGWMGIGLGWGAPLWAPITGVGGRGVWQWDKRERVYSREKWSQQRGVKDGPGCSAGDSVGVTSSPEAGAPERPLCASGLVSISRRVMKAFIYDSKQGAPGSLRALSPPGHPRTEGFQLEAPAVHSSPRELGTRRESGLASPLPGQGGHSSPQAWVPPP